MSSHSAFVFQCESSLVGPPARCWCVSSWNGKRIPGSDDLQGDLDCNQEIAQWRPNPERRSEACNLKSGADTWGRGGLTLLVTTLIYSENVNLYINHLTCLDLVSECFLFLKTANRFLTKQLHRLELHVHSSARPCSVSLSPFSFFFHSKVEPCTAAHSFDMLTLNVSPLVFPQWASREILKTPQVCAWPPTNISGLIQTAARFGLGRSLSTSTPHFRSMGFGSGLLVFHSI